MFSPEGHIRVFLYGQPVSMRLSYDGLYALARHAMKQDPLSGNLFAFINRRATQIKVLYFDRTGCHADLKRKAVKWADWLDAARFVTYDLMKPDAGRSTPAVKTQPETTPAATMAKGSHTRGHTVGYVPRTLITNKR